MEVGDRGFCVSVTNGGQRLASRSERFSSGVPDNQRSQKSTGCDVAKGKGKGHPTTDHECPDGEEMHSFTLSLTSALNEVVGQRHALAPLPREHGTRCTGGWVGLRAGLDGCGKSLPPPGFDPRIAQPVASRCTN